MARSMVPRAARSCQEAGKRGWQERLAGEAARSGCQERKALV